MATHYSILILSRGKVSEACPGIWVGLCDQYDQRIVMEMVIVAFKVRSLKATQLLPGFLGTFIPGKASVHARSPSNLQPPCSDATWKDFNHQSITSQSSPPRHQTCESGGPGFSRPALPAAEDDLWTLENARGRKRITQMSLPEFLNYRTHEM